MLMPASTSEHAVMNNYNTFYLSKERIAHAGNVSLSLIIANVPTLGEATVDVAYEPEDSFPARLPI